MCWLRSDLFSFLPRRVPVRLAVLVLFASAVAGWALPTYLTAKQRVSAPSLTLPANREGRGGVLRALSAGDLQPRLAPRSGLDLPSSDSGAASAASAVSPDELHLATDGATAALVARRIHELEPGCPDTTRYAIAQSVARWSRNNGLPWQVVTALIHHESRFDPQARSRTGDHGLCQLHGRPIYDIDENVRVGCVHLAGCVAGSGSMRAALATYNGGPGGSRAGRCLAYADAIIAVANEH